MRITGILTLSLAITSATSLMAQGPSDSGQARAAAARLSAAQRALANRQSILDRVTGRTSSTGAPRANAIGRANGNIPNVDALRRDALNRVGTQTGTGRLGLDVLRGRLRGRAATGRFNATEIRNRLNLRTGRRDADRRRDGVNRPDFAIRRNDDVSGGRAGFPLTRSERLLAKRLAQIEKLRDIALKNGNVRLMEQADRLEKLARQQHDRRVNGTPMHVPEIFRRDRPADTDGSGDAPGGDTTDGGPSDGSSGDTIELGVVPVPSNE